jgi:ribosome assembly protein YihI (activator of Der GTPase)
MTDQIDQLRASIEARRKDKSPEARVADRYEFALLSCERYERFRQLLATQHQRLTNYLEVLEQRQTAVDTQIDKVKQQVSELELTITSDVRDKLSQFAKDELAKSRQKDGG